MQMEGNRKIQNEYVCLFWCRTNVFTWNSAVADVGARRLSTTTTLVVWKIVVSISSFSPSIDELRRRAKKPITLRHESDLTKKIVSIESLAHITIYKW